MTVTASAPDAIQLLRRVMPDVLLTDISMPGQDGSWLVREFRTLPPDQGGKIPAVAITASRRRRAYGMTRPRRSGAAR